MAQLDGSQDGDEIVADSPEGPWRITQQQDGWRVHPPGTGDPEGAAFASLDHARRFAQHLSDRPS